MRHAARVDACQADIVKALRKAGAYVYYAKLPFDLIVGYRGKTLLMECKQPGGDIEKKLTPFQRNWMQAWCGGKVWLVSTPEEAIQALEESV